MGARRSPDEAVLGALITQLRATAAVTAVATAGSFVEVPQGTPAPYNQVGLPSARRVDTCGRFGAESVVDVASISQGASQLAGVRMRAAVIAALNAQTLAMSGQTMLGVSWETNEYFPEIVGGLKYHHHIATFRVWTEQSSS